MAPTDGLVPFVPTLVRLPVLSSLGQRGIQRPSLERPSLVPLISLPHPRSQALHSCSLEIFSLPSPGGREHIASKPHRTDRRLCVERLEPVKLRTFSTELADDLLTGRVRFPDIEDVPV